MSTAVAWIIIVSGTAVSAIIAAALVITASERRAAGQRSAPQAHARRPVPWLDTLPELPPSAFTDAQAAGTHFKITRSVREGVQVTCFCGWSGTIDRFDWTQWPEGIGPEHRHDAVVRHAREFDEHTRAVVCQPAPEPKPWPALPEQPWPRVPDGGCEEHDFRERPPYECACCGYVETNDPDPKPTYEDEHGIADQSASDTWDTYAPPCTCEQPLRAWQSTHCLACGGAEHQEDQ